MWVEVYFMVYAAIVFDFDGVILESTEVKSAAFHDLALPWGKAAADWMLEYHLAHFGVSRFLKFEWFFQNVLGREISPEESAALSDRFTALCLEKILEAPFVPGFSETLAQAGERFPLYVASATPQKELEQILELRGLQDCFQKVYGAPCKKSEVLLEIAAALGAEPQELLMVGDSPWDLAAAKEAGTAFYGRGARFQDSGYLWGEDLHNLAACLAAPA